VVFFDRIRQKKEVKSMKPIYITERLIVRQWEEKDYEDLYEYASDSNVTKYLSFPTYTSIETAKERIKFVIEQYESGNQIQDYAIEEKESGRVVGSIGIVRYSEKNMGELEIGYILRPQARGNGYMTEALKGMFKHIKENGLAKRIVLKHDVENVKSGNVMKRAGMTFEGILRRAGENNLHKRCDIAVYSILEEEIE
jgi:ribosomal-protein-alanine N-acetyltransferase